MAAISQRDRPTSGSARWSAARCTGNPALLAKITVNIDVISGGRLDWGIGAGWYEHEYRRRLRLRALDRSRATPIRASRDAARDGRDREADVERARRDLRRPLLHGRRRAVRSEAAAAAAPADLDRRRRRAADAAGRRAHADRSNFGGKPDEWRTRPRCCKGHCAAVGRDDDEITKTWSPEVFIRETEQEIVDGGSRSRSGASRSTRGATGNLVGTPEQVCEKIRAYEQLGCGGVVAWPADFPDTETLELLGREGHPRVPLTRACPRLPWG